MKKQRRQPNSNEAPVTSLIPPESYINVDTLTKLSLPLTLNEYFSPFISNIKDSLLFLERFAEEDETISKLVNIYNNDPDFSNKLNDTLDLDLLAKKADVSRGEFRRLIISTLDLMGDEEAMMLLKLSKKHLIKKSIQIGMTDNHPDSYDERHALLQFFGIHPTPKNSTVSINVDKSQNLSMSQTQIGLPSFSEHINSSEKVASTEIQKLLNKDNQDIIDLAIENKENKGNKIPLYSDKSPLIVKVETLPEEDSNEDSEENEDEGED